MQRALRSHLLGLPELAILTFEARQRFVASAARVDLPPGERRELPDGAFAFVALGTVAIERDGGGATTMRAPALLATPRPFQAVSADSAVMAVLPGVEAFAEEDAASPPTDRSAPPDRRGDAPTTADARRSA